MLKGEPCGAPQNRPLGRPLIQVVSKKSSSPVQTAINQNPAHTRAQGFLVSKRKSLLLKRRNQKKQWSAKLARGSLYCRATPWALFEAPAEKRIPSLHVISKHKSLLLKRSNQEKQWSAKLARGSLYYGATPWAFFEAPAEKRM